MWYRLKRVPICKNLRYRNVGILDFGQTFDNTYFTSALSVNRQPRLGGFMRKYNDFQDSEFGKGISYKIDAVRCRLIQTAGNDRECFVIGSLPNKIDRVTTLKVDESGS